MEQAELKTNVDLKELVSVFKNIQKTRIAYQNIVRQKEIPQIQQIYSVIINVFEDVEIELKKYIKSSLTNYPIFEKYLKHVKGIGDIIAAQLIAIIGDIERFKTVSKLWKYAGLGIENGRADRLAKGKKSSFNPKFRALMYNIGLSFIRVKSPYIVFYNQAKMKYQEKHPEWTKKHIHLASLRYMNKIFLSHVYNAWYRLKGLPMKKPYPIQYLEKTQIILPEHVIGDLELPEPIWKE